MYFNMTHTWWRHPAARRLWRLLAAVPAPPSVTLHIQISGTRHHSSHSSATFTMLFRTGTFRPFPRVANVASRAALPAPSQLLGRVGPVVESPIQQQVRTMAAGGGGRKKKGKKQGAGDTRIRMFSYSISILQIGINSHSLTLLQA